MPWIGSRFTTSQIRSAVEHPESDFIFNAVHDVALVRTGWDFFPTFIMSKWEAVGTAGSGETVWRLSEGTLPEKLKSEKQAEVVAP